MNDGLVAVLQRDDAAEEHGLSWIGWLLFQNTPREWVF